MQQMCLYNLIKSLCKLVKWLLLGQLQWHTFNTFSILGNELMFSMYLPSLCSFCILRSLLLVSLKIREDYNKSPASWVLHQEGYNVEHENDLLLILGSAGSYFLGFFPELYASLLLCWSAVPQIHKIFHTCYILCMLDVCSLISLKLVLPSSQDGFPLMTNNWPMKNLSNWGFLVSSCAGTFRAFRII